MYAKIQLNFFSQNTDRYLIFFFKFNSIVFLHNQMLFFSLNVVVFDYCIHQVVH